jgi:hypothetical protein
LHSITRGLFVASVLILGSASAQAQGKLDAYMPGEMMGMAMSQNVFDAFFADKEAKAMRSTDEFMAAFNKMDATDKMIVRIACSLTDDARKGFSDRISSSCRAAGF